MRCYTRYRKRNTATATTEPIDPELWLQAAHAANEDEAVSWFASIHGKSEPTLEKRTPKRGRLDSETTRWENYLTASDKLARQHAQRARDTCCNAHTAQVARRHLQALHTIYTNTLTAKTEYHLLVTNLLKEHIEAQRLHNTYTTMCLERRQWYVQAKHDTVRRYADIKTSLLT